MCSKLKLSAFIILLYIREKRINSQHNIVCIVHKVYVFYKEVSKYVNCFTFKMPIVKLNNKTNQNLITRTVISSKVVT